jgi:hypothetical protein
VLEGAFAPFLDPVQPTEIGLKVAIGWAILTQQKAY